MLFPLISQFLSLPFAKYMIKPYNFDNKYCRILENQFETLSSCSVAKKWAQKDWKDEVHDRNADKNGKYNYYIAQPTANLCDPMQLPVAGFAKELFHYNAQNDRDSTDAHGGV